jgi:uncharacterized membrane protein YfcA
MISLIAILGTAIIAVINVLALKGIIRPTALRYRLYSIVGSLFLLIEGVYRGAVGAILLNLFFIIFIIYMIINENKRITRTI